MQSKNLIEYSNNKPFDEALSETHDTFRLVSPPSALFLSFTHNQPTARFDLGMFILFIWGPSGWRSSRLWAHQKPNTSEQLSSHTPALSSACKNTYLVCSSSSGMAESGPDINRMSRRWWWEEEILRIITQELDLPMNHCFTKKMRLWTGKTTGGENVLCILYLNLFIFSCFICM